MKTGPIPAPGRLLRSVFLTTSVIAALADTAAVRAQTIDAFDSVREWRAAPASGVTMSLDTARGRSGTALQMRFDFNGGGGWAAFRRETQLRLPENYEISFWLKGDAPRNTLELKLVDASGENVWWVNRPEFEYAGDWRRITFRRRHVKFAWGPQGGGDIRDVAAIELAVTAGTGGRGTIWIDDLAVTPREPVLPYTATPVITTARGVWTMDFTRNREYGGIIVDWKAPGAGRSFDVLTSMDGVTWTTVRNVRGGRRQRDYLQLPESESRYVRIAAARAPGGAAPDATLAAGIAAVRVQPIDWGESPNRLYETMAADAPRGSFPKYLTGTQSYWTVIGENGHRREAMINEEGAVEVGRRMFSIEPFLHVDDSLITWADARITQSLEDGYLPIPSVTWDAAGLTLRTTAWVADSMLWLRYRVGNPGAAGRNASLVLAVRPFQVNPTSQFLNYAGGFAPISSIVRASGDLVAVDTSALSLVTRPDVWRAYSFDEGEAVSGIRDRTGGRQSVMGDSTGGASGALTYRLAIGARDSADVLVAVRFSTSSISAVAPVQPTAADAARSFSAARETWRAELDRFSIDLPASLSQVERSIYTNLAYVLINRDGAAIQPGSRSYERSWIRDGSLTSAALLRLGHAEEVRAFIEWYAPFQYADGKVPCCVDARGADPVPEHDSHGELIYLITEYVRFTGDTALAARLWPHVARAVTHMDSLRGTRRTAEYVNTEFFGLLPQSISHEGYSARPMHSYWDDSFALKGYKDAVWLATLLRKDASGIARLVQSRDEFQRDLVQSLETAMQKRGIDYLPGAAELGDFDATSTTVAVNPAGARSVLPQRALARTFEKYWEEFTARRAANAWEAYTPYEWRVVGTLVRLGEKRRAHEVAAWFMEHQRPVAWNHWSEAVFRESTVPRFIGDMPHTWVGSDFIRSMLDMFVYDEDDALVLGAGILPAWLSSDPVGVHGIRTQYGTIGYSMVQRGTSVVVRFDQGTATPPDGVVFHSPLDGPIVTATADGVRVEAGAGRVLLRSLPRELVLSYQ